MLKRAPLNYITQLLLLGVYAAFFLVQTLYVPSNNHQVAAETPGFAASKHTSKISLEKKNFSLQKHTRLNKRFQPEMMPAFGYAGLPERMEAATPRAIVRPSDYLLISSILTDSLRGPPVLD